LYRCVHYIIINIRNININMRRDMIRLFLGFLIAQCGFATLIFYIFSYYTSHHNSMDGSAASSTSSEPSSKAALSLNGPCNAAAVSLFHRCAKLTVMPVADLTTLIQSIYLLVSLLEYHNITYSVFGGTLIGILRHGGIIPWDDDFDVFVQTRDRAKLREIFHKRQWPPMEKVHLPMPKSHRSHSMSISPMSSSSLSPRNTITVDRSLYDQLVYLDDERIPKLFLNKTNCIRPPGYPYCWPYMDIFYFNDNGTHFNFDGETIPEGTFSHDQWLPPRRAKYETIPVWIPRDLSTFLPVAAVESCCTRQWMHKVENKPLCFMCIPCECLKSIRWLR
jgi:hypothetical protein